LRPRRQTRYKKEERVLEEKVEEKKQLLKTMCFVQWENPHYCDQEEEQGYCNGFLIIIIY